MAASINSFPLDPSKSAKYPVTISKRLLQPDAPRKRRKISVQCNYKPKLPGSSTTSVIKPLPGGADYGYNLSLKNLDNGNEYIYKGDQTGSETTALVYNPSDHSFVLDRIDTEFHFNLQSTPTNKDAASLAVQYPQLETGLPSPEDEAANDLFGEDENGDDDEAAADPSNPYDYRHFLKTAGKLKPSPSPSPSPLPNHTPNSSPLIHNPTTTWPSRPQKVNLKPKPRPNPPRQNHLSPNLSQEVDADNEASDADNDVLTIDMGEPSINNARPWRSVLSGLNDGRPRSGPISLRSAASSMSPSLRGDSDDDGEVENKSNADVEEIDLGTGGETVNDEDEDEDEEKEVVEVAVTPGNNGWDEEEDLVAEELEQALMSEAEQEGRERERTGLVSGYANGYDGSYTDVNGNEDHVYGGQSSRIVEESSEESEEE